MPIYEYRCTACGGEFEYQQRMSEDAKTECESCGGALERLISLSAFHLKGGGWYKDLYSSSKPDQSSSEGSAADADSSSDSGGKDAGSDSSGKDSSRDSGAKDSKSSGSDTSSASSKTTSTSDSAS